MRLALFAVIVAVFVFVAGSAPVPRVVVAAAAPPAPCSLLTPAEVSDAFGVAVKAGELANPTLCTWAAGGKRLTLLITDDKNFAGARQAAGLPDITVDTIPGIGDDAVMTTTGTTFASIMVKKGPVYFMLRVYGFPLDQAKTKEKTLAAAAAKKI
jgi:hypothetical protein